MSGFMNPSASLSLATPSRPPRSLERLTIHTSRSTPSLCISSFTDPLSPPTPNSPSPATPTTPLTPSGTSQQRSVSRKSTQSIKRKPVPTHQLGNEKVAQLSGTMSLDALVSISPNAQIQGEEDSLAILNQLRSFDDSQPPQYILPADPPCPAHLHDQVQSPISAPPDYIGFPRNHSPIHYSHYILSSQRSRDVQVDVPFGSATVDELSIDQLPSYAKETETEPKTLARELWKWGFIFPGLWFLGLFIFWIPLRPVEEELDPEKAQRLEEMIVIIRQAELKYARRCAIAFGCFISLILIIVALAVILTHFV